MTHNPPTYPSTPNPIPIILLKTKSHPHDSYDEYLSSVSPSPSPSCPAPPPSFRPVFVPVLQHKVRDEELDQVRELVRSTWRKERNVERNRQGERERGAECDNGGDEVGVKKEFENVNGTSNRNQPEEEVLLGGKYGGMVFTSQRAVEGFAAVVAEVGKEIKHEMKNRRLQGRIKDGHATGTVVDAGSEYRNQCFLLSIQRAGDEVDSEERNENFRAEFNACSYPRSFYV